MKKRKYIVCMLGMVMTMLCMSGCGKAANDMQESYEESGSIQENGQEKTKESTQEHSQAADTGVNETANAVSGWIGDEYPYEQELQIVDDNYRNYYEIFVYSFYDSDGDGIGDLNGVTQKLDYIQDMGFNGIWLMPVFQSTTYHKYDITDYMQIDSEYGSTEDMQNLIEECHKRGIRIILDFVMNHTSSQHLWFTQACEYLEQLPRGAEPNEKECPYVGYYHFANEQKQDYYQVKNTDWYYEGVFWSEMPDLNLENEQLRAELEQIASYWIGMGIDGFRMDAAMHFEENDATTNTEILNWFYEYCLSQNPDFYMVSEVWANEATVADYYASGTPSMFNFDLADKEGKLIKAARGTYKAANLVQSMLKVLSDIYKSVAEPTHSGILDEPTADSLSSFQILCGLPMTGTLDKHTWKHLALHYPLATNLNNLP